MKLPLVIRLFYVSIWATLLFNVVACSSSGKKYDITNHTSTSTINGDSILSAIPKIDTPVTTTTVVESIPVSTQLKAAADSIVNTVSIARNPQTIEPKSDIETNDFKYSYQGGKYTPCTVDVKVNGTDVTITENGTAANTYIKQPPITITQGTKSRTETFILKDVQGNSYPTAFFYLGQEETPWAVRLPKRTLFRRMPRNAELKEILRNSNGHVAPKPCPCQQYHTVEKGTVANGIAAYRKLTLEELQKLNPGVKLTDLKVAQKLCIARKVCK